MATKRKPAKKSRKTAQRKAKPTKKIVRKAKASRKSAARNKPARSKAPAKAKRPANKASSAKKTSAKKASSRQPSPQPSRQQRPARSARPFSRDLRGPDSAGQSGDLQGLSNRERADSESVDELLEEGNSFEAGVVEGVEEADENEGSEVHTHEVPEDDVPGEYLDED